MNPRLSIIIPTMDRQHILAETLENLIRATAATDVEIIVVNDSKTTQVNVAHAGIIVLDNPKQGAASARNFGFAHATGELILFLDDDMLLSSDVLETLITHTLTTERAIFQPNWEYPPVIVDRLRETTFGRFLVRIGYTSLSGWLNRTEDWHEEIVQQKGIASYCLLLRRSDFIALGGYNEIFPFAGFEDYDLTQRLQAQQFSFYILTRKTIFHNELDRMQLEGFLERRRRNGATQRKAVELGYSESKLAIGGFRALVYPLIYALRKPLIFFSLRTPNRTAFDRAHDFLAHLLTGAYIYNGYRKPKILQ